MQASVPLFGSSSLSSVSPGVTDEWFLYILSLWHSRQLAFWWYLSSTCWHYHLKTCLLTGNRKKKPKLLFVITVIWNLFPNERLYKILPLLCVKIPTKKCPTGTSYLRKNQTKGCEEYSKWLWNTMLTVKCHLISENTMT